MTEKELIPSPFLPDERLKKVHKMFGQKNMMVIYEKVIDGENEVAVEVLGACPHFWVEVLMGALEQMTEELEIHEQENKQG